MHNARHAERKDKPNIANIPRVWPKQGMRKVKIRHCHTQGMWPKQGRGKINQALPTSKRYGHKRDKKHINKKF